MGGGHNSVVVDEYGNLALVYHARPYPDPHSGQSGAGGLFDPCRHTAVKSIHVAADGTLIFNMTAEEELAEENRTITAVVTIDDGKEEPTPEPTEEPTPEPTEEPMPEPTEEPTGEPTPEPTEEPTGEPTPEPTEEPTGEPTPEPTEEPTGKPTEKPTAAPTEKPDVSGTPGSTQKPSDSAQTGDSTNLAVPAALILSALGYTGVVINKKRRMKENQ